MISCQWELFDQWKVNNSYRVIFKPRESGAHLVDVTLECNNINEIIAEVLRVRRTSGELMSYLNKTIAA
ncbi:MAG: hypothetical protein LLG02_03945 [Pelosinus sp.]|nr:hypothetical protein [Pelosinus sp.]